MELFHILAVASLLPLPFAAPSCVGSLSPGVKICAIVKDRPLVCNACCILCKCLNWNGLVFFSRCLFCPPCKTPHLWVGVSVLHSVQYVLALFVLLYHRTLCAHSNHNKDKRECWVCTCTNFDAFSLLLVCASSLLTAVSPGAASCAVCPNPSPTGLLACG